MGMGCDKMPWSKSEPKAEPQQPAPPPAQEKPAAAPAEAAKPASGEPSQEVKAHLKQGMSYVSIAKNATSKSVFNENLDNAIAEFSNAITKDPNYAEAYSNRAVAYMLQKKNNKALDDLKKAKEIKPDSATIRWAISAAGATGRNAPAAAPSSTSRSKNPAHRSDIAAHTASSLGCRRARAQVSIHSTYSSRRMPSEGMAKSMVRRSSSTGSAVSSRNSCRAVLVCSLAHCRAARSTSSLDL